MSVIEGEEIQKLAEAHLDACFEAMWAWENGDDDAESPAFGPFCGCQTCQVREILAVTVEERAKAAEQQAFASPDNVYVPVSRALLEEIDGEWRGPYMVMIESNDLVPWGADITFRQVEEGNND